MYSQSAMLQIYVMLSTLHVYVGLVGPSVMSISTPYIQFSGGVYYSALFLVKPIFSIVKTSSPSEEPSTLVN